MVSAGELKSDLARLQGETETERDNFGQYGQTAKEQQELLRTQNENVKEIVAHIAAAMATAETVFGTAKKVEDTDDTLSARILESSGEVDRIHGEANELIGADTNNSDAQDALENLSAASSKSEDASEAYAQARDKTASSVQLAGQLWDSLKELVNPANELGELADQANSAIDNANDSIDEVVGHTGQAASNLENYNSVV